MADNIPPQQGDGTPMRFPELVIGLVGPIGSDMKKIADGFERALGHVAYGCKIISIIEGLLEFPSIFKAPPQFEDERYLASMDNGDKFREMLGNDALGLLAMAMIRKERISRKGDENTPVGRMSYILKQLKTPEEIKTLREIYRRNMLVVGVFSKMENRRNNLVNKIAVSHGRANRSEEFGTIASDLIKRDERDREKRSGQNVQEAFQVSDVFVNADGDFQSAIERIVELLFGNGFITPSQEEYGMFHARAASFRSSSLGRQVGAAICNDSGEVISLGCNEVPKAFGGTCWDSQKPDNRDHSCRETDTNDSEKSDLLRDVIERLHKKGWLNETLQKKGVEALLEEALADTSNDGIGRAELMGITEYGRAVHAEMAAILDAGRRGVSVDGATLYSTTFPCHNCAKHIIAAGIKNVVYIEPYPKSRAAFLHNEDIEIDEAKPRPETHVQFRAFVGVAPRQYSALFSIGDIKRKEKGGKVKKWEAKEASLRNKEHQITYVVLEQEKARRFGKALVELGLASGAKKADKNAG